jgi:hypothetical protein
MSIFSSISVSPNLHGMHVHKYKHALYDDDPRACLAGKQKLNMKQDFLVKGLRVLGAWSEDPRTGPVTASECTPNGSFWQECQQVAAELTELDTELLKSWKVQPLLERFRSLTMDTDIPALQNDVSDLVTTVVIRGRSGRRRLHSEPSRIIYKQQASALNHK